MTVRALVVLILLGLAVPAGAQQRPLATEDPETVGAGLVLLEGGFDYQRSVFYPLSGLEGHLLRVPTLGLSFGLGPSAELQIDGGVYNGLAITSRQVAPLSSAVDVSGDRSYSIEDITVATKVRVMTETPGRPALGFRFATRLPMTSNESGLGLDTTDFFVSALVGKTVRSVRLVANGGLGLLSQPLDGTSQNDVLTYGVSVARAVAQGVELVGEVNGRLHIRDVEAPLGTESRGTLRAGGRVTQGSVRFDGGIIVGLTSNDTSFGVTAGLTWVFRQ